MSKKIKLLVKKYIPMYKCCSKIIILKCFWKDVESQEGEDRIHSTRLPLWALHEQRSNSIRVNGTIHLPQGYLATSIISQKYPFSMWLER